MTGGLHALTTRLIALRNKWAPGGRPADKSFGRWLGDFLTEESDHGLLPAELTLLDAAAIGGALEPDDPATSPPLVVRAEFLRFLILGGDESAPIHEAGIELHHTRIISQLFPSDRLLDLRGCKCTGRIAMLNCELPGILSIQDATIGILALEGSSLNGISGDRAKISGTVFLNRCSISDSVSFINAEIGGSFQCSGTAFRRNDQASPDPAYTMLDLSGAKISGPVFLNKSSGEDGTNFVSDGGIAFFGTQIGGNLDCNSASVLGPLNCSRATIRSDLICTSGSFTRGIEAQSAVVAGDVNFTSLSAARTVTLAGAQIGGSFWCGSATLRKNPDDMDYTAATMLDFSRATIKGHVSLSSTGTDLFVCEGTVAFASARIGADLYFWGASITISRTAKADRKSVVTLDGQNVIAGGSIFFGGGFVTNGQVSLYGAEVSKDLDFSGSIFHNAPGWAIVANMSKILGSLKFQTSGDGPDRHPFRAFGGVSLFGLQCADMICDGARFNNPGGMALDCRTMNVAGSVVLGSSGETPFEALGTVSFNSARIGQHLSSSGGRLTNPEAAFGPQVVALDCGAMQISGFVSLCNAGNTPFWAEGMISFNTSVIGQHLDLRGAKLQNPRGTVLDCQAGKIAGCVFLGVNSDDPNAMPFDSDGKVLFIGATVGLQFNCQSGYFRNGEEYPAGSGQAAIALDLSVTKIGDTLYLGREQFGSQPPKIEGSVDLTGATVRVLVDDGFVDDKSRGLRPTVDRNDPKGLPKRLQCTIELDQFSYDRLKGDRAFESDMRKAWLQRQPPEDLRGAFKPQPFEQLVTVMRAMGYDDEADDIALFKRQTKRQTTALIDIPELDWRFPSQAAGVVAAAWLAIVGNHLIVAFIVLFWLFRKVLAKLGEILLLDWFVGYGYNIARAVSLLLLLIFGFGEFYASAFQQGAIVAVDKDVREAMACLPVLAKPCKPVQFNGTPLFNPWLYSADVMVPVVTFGQKAAWAPNPDADVKLPVLRPWKAPTNLVYDVQLIETVLGWIEGFLLVSFVTGLIAKE